MSEPACVCGAVSKSKQLVEVLRAGSSSETGEATERYEGQKGIFSFMELPPLAAMV